MNILLSILMLCLSFSDLRAQDSEVQSEEIKVDIYLTHAGWAKQDGGYMDPETHIIWGPEVNDRSWGEAKTYCESLVYGGRNDWRLPTVEELQRSVCKEIGYATRTACPKPRNHQTDLWLLNKKMEKGITYWAANLVPGDPYNAYYFLFDVEGQHVLTSKGDKSRSRCVTMSKVNLPTAKQTVAAAVLTEPEKKEFTFYIAPLIGFGGFFTTAIELNNYAFLSGELRMGFKMADRFMGMFSADTGFNLRDRTYPIVSTFSVGPEYFIIDNLSIFGAFGLGILTANSNIISAITTETHAGFDWKVGINWQPIRWGDNNQYGMPISVTYTGVKTQWITTHVVLLSVGFMYFN